MDKRTEIVQTAHSFLDVKWVHQGRKPNAIDCAGLIVLTAKETDLIPPGFKDITNYRRVPNGFAFKKMFDTYMDRVPLSRVQNGDIVIFGEGIYACHCGILFYENDTLYMIHAYCERGKVVKERITPYWRKLIKGTYKYKGVQ